MSTENCILSQRLYVSLSQLAYLYGRTKSEVGLTDRQDDVSVGCQGTRGQLFDAMCLLN